MLNYTRTPKKRSKKTFTAEISTNIDLTQNFFLRPGLHPDSLPSRNDSFSFTNKSKEIFNPVENASCVKKETPKFGRADQHTSTPSKNMLHKLALVRNQIRLENTFKQVLQVPPAETASQLFRRQFLGQKMRGLGEAKKPRRPGSSRQAKVGGATGKENTSFLSKGKGGSVQKRSKKGPKILGQKHLEIFHNKFLDKEPSKFDCFLGVPGRNPEASDEPQKRVKLPLYHDPFKPSGREAGDLLTNLCTPAKLSAKPSSNAQVNARQLSKMFQNQFRQGIIDSFRNIKPAPCEKSPGKEGLRKPEGLPGNPKLGFQDQSAKRHKKRKLNLRYQSARKCPLPLPKPVDLGMTTAGLGSSARPNNFLMRELRFMLDKPGRGVLGARKANRPSTEFRL